MSIEKSITPKTVRQITKGKEKYRFDLSIQRNANRWDKDRKSLLIHSLIYGYPIPPMYSQDIGDTSYWMLDGKQRLTTIISYIENEFVLSDNTPNINGVEIAGLKFEELPEEIKDELLSVNLNIYQMKGMTEEERDEMFLRLNNGVALSKIELTRVAGGSSLMDYISEIAEHNFFRVSCNITDSARSKFTDQEIILQCFSLYMEGEDRELTGRSIREFVEMLKNDEIDDITKKEIVSILDYLTQVFPEKSKLLKKVNIPIVFFMAERFKDELSITDFAFNVTNFLKNTSEKYKEACKAGSAKASNVRIRLEELQNAIEERYINQEKEAESEVFTDYLQAI